MCLVSAKTFSSMTRIVELSLIVFRSSIAISRALLVPMDFLPGIRTKRIIICCLSALLPVSISGTDDSRDRFPRPEPTDPELKTSELQPFSAENYNLTGLLSPKTNQVYFSYNNLWKIDPKTRKMQTAELSNTYFVPLLHPDGKKVYCGANWHDIAVFDADTLTPITKIALSHSQTGGGNDLRFVNR